MQAFEALGVARACFGIFWLLLWLISRLCCREFETLSANVPDRTRQHKGDIQGLFSLAACGVQGFVRGFLVCFDLYSLLQLWICLYMNFNYSLQGFQFVLLCHPCDVVAVLVDLQGFALEMLQGAMGGKSETLSVIYGFKYFYHFLKPLLR